MLPLGFFSMSISSISRGMAWTEAILTSGGHLSGPHLLARKAGLLKRRLSAQSRTFFSSAFSPSRTKSIPATASSKSGAYPARKGPSRAWVWAWPSDWALDLAWQSASARGSVWTVAEAPA